MDEGVETVPVSVRMPIEVYNVIKKEAGRERRSMNSQIIVLLEQALPAKERAETAVSAATPA